MIYQLIGISLFGLGFIHYLEITTKVEHGIVKSIQGRFNCKPYLHWFQEIWFFGRTTFAVIVLVLLTGYNWKLGLIALVVFGLMAGLEKLVKEFVKRSRPFVTHQDIQMLQPREPVDSSFPSGDALRIWFLASILSIAIGNSLLFGFISSILAGLVTLGRIVLGVHYLTDVLAGAGLGLLGAGTTIWLWQLFQLL